MEEHAHLLETVSDPELRGMWLVWHCFVAYCLMKLDDSVAAADRAIAIAEASGSARILAYAHTQRSWALGFPGRNDESLVSSEKAPELIGRLTDERDSRYIRFKAGTSAALSRLNIGDLIKARAMAKDVMDFAVTSGRARALSMAHVAAGVINNTTGEPERAIAELQRARDVAPDPVYRLMGEINLVGVLANSGKFQAAREILDPMLSFRTRSRHDCHCNSGTRNRGPCSTQ